MDISIQTNGEVDSREMISLLNEIEKQSFEGCVIQNETFLYTELNVNILPLTGKVMLYWRQLGNPQDGLYYQYIDIDKGDETDYDSLNDLFVNECMKENHTFTSNDSVRVLRRLLIKTAQANRVMPNELVESFDEVSCNIHPDGLNWSDIKSIKLVSHRQDGIFVKLVNSDNETVIFEDIETLYSSRYQALIPKEEHI